MDTIEAIHGRRSVRDYLSDVPARSLVEALIDDAAKAPFTPISPPDPWVFNVFEGRDRIAAFGERALRYAREHRPQVDGYRWADDPGFSVFHGAPVVIVISGKTANPLALEECTRAAQILTLSAYARGLGTCWVGSPNLWLRDPLVRAEIGIPPGFTPYAALTLGYPALPSPEPVTLKPRVIWPDGPSVPKAATG
jgi:nitroreductase